MQKQLSKKGVIFQYNSKINCVYDSNRGYKMRTSLHMVFNFIFDNEYSLLVISKIHGRKMQFSASSQIAVSEKSIFGQFEVISLNV